MTKYKQLNDKSWLEEQYIQESKSYRQIAKEIGCGATTLLRSLEKHAIKRRDNNKSQYELLNDYSWMYQKYAVEKMSTKQIAHLAGAKTCNSARQSLIKHGIPIRSVSEGLTCNRIDDGFVLNEYSQQVIEGGLLGDAGMKCWNNSSSESNSFFYRRNKHYDHVLFVASQIGLSGERVKEHLEFATWDKQLSYTVFSLHTLTHKELNHIHKRWYPKENEFIKLVPRDFVLTPISLLHWFMDDGCSFRRKREHKKINFKHNNNQILITLCSESFSREDNLFLSQQLSDLFNLDARVRPYTGNNNGSGYRISIPQSQAQHFFEVIGDCPVPSLQYKWKINAEMS